jgi:hypothetical protein
MQAPVVDAVLRGATIDVLRERGFAASRSSESRRSPAGALDALAAGAHPRGPRRGARRRARGRLPRVDVPRADLGRHRRSGWPSALERSASCSTATCRSCSPPTRRSTSTGPVGRRTTCTRSSGSCARGPRTGRSASQRGRGRDRGRRVQRASRGRTSTSAGRTHGRRSGAPRAWSGRRLHGSGPSRREEEPGDEGAALTMSMTLPTASPSFRASRPSASIPEPPRRGEPGGRRARSVGGSTTRVWSTTTGRCTAPVGGSLPGAVWIASSEHVDSFADSPEAWRRLRRVGGAGRAGDPLARRRRARAPLPLGRRRRALPRLAVLRAARDARAPGMMLPLWEDALPERADAELGPPPRRVADAM